jgi:hypothetical protein
MSDMTEAEITKAIIKWLETLPNTWIFKIHGHGYGLGGSQKTGVPDICLESERFGRIWLEVKTAKGQLKPSQEREFPKMQAAGARVHIVRSLEEVKAILLGEAA